MADVSKFKLGNTTYNIRDDVARSGYIRVFDTVAEMQAATDLSAGMICRTNGFHAIDDNGAGFYVIESGKTANGMNILACQNSLFATLLVTEGTIRPEMYGAYGDNIHEDTDVLIAVVNSGKPVSFTPFATYYISRQIIISGQNNVTIEGNGASLIMNYLNSNGRTILGIENSSDITINNVRVTTDFSTDNDEDLDVQGLFSAGPYGISINNNCTRIRITRCDVSMVQDGISANDSTEVMLVQNRIYNIGQEPIAARQSYNVTISGNDLYWHAGDGILIKAYAQDIMTNIVIEGNLIHDPKRAVSSSNVHQLGGGITCNAENTTTVPLTKGMIISNNTIDGCRYGVTLGNISDAVISSNVARVGVTNTGVFADGSNAFGVLLETAFNPSTPKTMTRVLFSNNIAIGGKVQFRSRYNDSSAPAEGIVFDGNIGISGDLATSDFCFYAQNSTIINNTVSGAARIGEFFNCIVRGNEMSGATTTPTNAQTSDWYFRGDTCIVEGNKFSGHQVYFNCGVLAHITNNEFSLDMTQSIKTNCASTAHIWFDGNTFNGAELVDGNVSFYGTTANILTDFYRRYSITVNSTEVGYINANRDTIMVYADADYTTGTAIITVSDAYFRPTTSNKQIMGFVTTNTSAARVAYQTNGALVVRAATTNSGHVVINATMHK